jgi:hypothetical protein
MGKRLLVVAGEAATSAGDLPFGVQQLLRAAEEILVVTPALPTRFEWLASATDKAREQADERLQTVLGQLEDLGSEARGTVGADDPLLAFEDALREFPPITFSSACGRATVRTGKSADCSISSLSALPFRSRSLA